MIIVSAFATASPGRRDEFIREAQPSIAATRKENGCIMYNLYASTEHPDKLLYFEKWESREALAAHSVSDHMNAFKALKKEKGLQVGDIEVGIFEATLRD